MDADHVELVELFDLLGESVEKARGKDFCCSVLDRIIEQAKAHFALEERVMAEHRYPIRSQHEAEHAMLIAQAVDYRSRFQADAATLPVAIAHFPEVWLAFHILFSDKKLADFLAHGD